MSLFENIAGTVMGALGCVVGGRIADRTDKRKALNVYIALMTVVIATLVGVAIGAMSVAAVVGLLMRSPSPSPLKWGSRWAAAQRVALLTLA